MQDAVSPSSQPLSPIPARFFGLASRVRAEFPTLSDCAVATASAALLVFSFPDFNLWPLAWLALVPLLLLVGRKPQTLRCFFLGWLFGSIFFYGSCYWLTYSMIHFGGIPTVFAFVLLLPGPVVMGIFPGIFAAVLARVVRRWGAAALFVAPLFWAALEWLRLEITGQLWNAIGYSQAYHPLLIQSATWGGVYAVGFIVVFVNAALTFALLKRNGKALVGSAIAIGIIFLAAMFLTKAARLNRRVWTSGEIAVSVVAIQPNVPMDLIKTTDELAQLTERHFQMSEGALKTLPDNGQPRLLIWPESPMNFTYGTDSRLRERLAQFAKLHHTSVLLNSQEAAPNDGSFNSALLINEAGSLGAQYDKIRLLPFGEYVPLPQWLPGAGLIKAIVGDFTQGTDYRLMPVGNERAGVFICIESAYPDIARRFTQEGSDVLINISNDGYLGPTAVMRQHLANAVFRAVENQRPLLRVTNSGITAFITPAGEVRDATRGFTPETRIWTIGRADAGSKFYRTFYTRHGDLFVIACACLSLLMFGLSFWQSSEKQ
ncbi:MAG TPA: apolipoprotein N-acyltransferase [Pyrinomonadaceae bacterium]|nr:apolipoprotein N-acyltransferase [Pyrinomonadaceae bacterium]